MLRYLGFRAAAAVLPNVPSRPAYLATRVAADVTHQLARRTRATLEHNLRHVLGDAAEAKQLHRCSRAAFRNLLWNYLELFHLPGMELAELDARGEVHGLEHLEAAADGPGPGALIVFAHVGNLEVVCQLALRQPGHRFAVVVERMPDARVHTLLLGQRQSQGLETVLADEPVDLLRRFREGAHLILAGDLDTTGSGTVVDLFGRPARLPHGAVKLALRTGAPLLVVAGWRTSAPRRPERFEVRVDPPLRLEGSPNDPAEVRDGVRRLAARLEGIIETRPEQWLAFRDVWDGSSERSAVTA